MTTEEIRNVLHDALKLRIPQFDPNTPPRTKMTALEEHILKCAYVRAELEEALHWMIEAGKALRMQWDSHEGYQAALRSGSRVTQEQVAEAKRRTGMQEVWEGIEEAKALVNSLTRQISRLGGSDYDAASRAYTLMSGS